MKAGYPRHSRSCGDGAAGFTLIETLAAIGLLAVGVMGLATLIPFATQNDFRSRLDTTATFVAAQVLEEMLSQPFTITSFTASADGAGNTTTVDLTCGAPPCMQGANLFNRLIDFSEDFAAVPANYKRLYVINPSGDDAAPRVNRGTYDVRWNIFETATRYRIITIAARPLGNNPGATTMPANLRVVRMR